MLWRIIGLSLIVLGDVVIIVCLAADPLGLGAEAPIIGPLQIGGAVGGIVIQLVGVIFSQVEPNKKRVIS